MPNKLYLTDSSIEIHCARNDAETLELVSKLYPVHRNRIGTLFKVSSRFTPEILMLFRGLDVFNIDTAPKNIQCLYEKEHLARIATDTLLSGGANLENPVVTPQLTLRPHQQVARELAKVRDRFGFFYDTRTGKTPLSLAIIYDDLKAHPDHKWLVVCPLILIENAWKEDATQFLPDVKVVSCHAATKKKRLEAMQQPANIYIVNTESFVAYREYIEQLNVYGCFVDESSSMKSTSSKVSNALVDFAQTVKKWYLLSGTPAPNGEWEYFQQLKSIDPYCVPQSYSQFKDRYFIDVSRSDQYEDLVLLPHMRDELYSILRNYSVYVDKEDVLDTPGRTFYEVEIELPKDLKAQYNLMKDKMAIELQDSFITAPSAAAKLNKLNQITSGFVIDTQAVKENKFNEEQRQETYLLDSYRFTKLYELLADQGTEQVLIWANYRKEFEILQEHFGSTCRCIYGGTNIAEKNEAIKLFKTGQIQYLIANPASADKGLTLTNAHIAVYFSLNWSYETYKQSMERIYADRSKQPKHCNYYILLAKGTIDVVLYREVLQGKADASYAVLNHLKGGQV